MLSDHDEALVSRLRAATGCTRAVADAPDAVARVLVASAGAELVTIDDLAGADLVITDIGTAGPAHGEGDRLATLARRIREAEHVVAGAVAHEGRRARRIGEGPAASAAATDDDAAAARADHQAVRFALVVLVLAQLGGIAVFVAAGDLVAVVAPAVALVGLALVVAHHQRPAPGGPPARSAPAAPEADVSASPTVRAAEAHLRRQQAAWKVAWWERQQPVPDAGAWGAGGVRTLVCVDHDGAIDERTYATMTAGLPAVIRVVLLGPRRT